MTESNPGRRRRLWILCAFRSNALVRRQDRVEAIAGIVLLALLIAAVPVAVHTGRAAGAAETQRNLHYTQSLESVEATVVEVRSTMPSRVPTLVRNVRVEWTQAFEERSELIAMKDAVRVGDRLTIWLDEAGRPADPVRRSQRVQSAELGVGLAVWTGTTLWSWPRSRCCMSG